MLGLWPAGCSSQLHTQKAGPTRARLRCLTWMLSAADSSASRMFLGQAQDHGPFPTAGGVPLPPVPPVQGSESAAWMSASNAQSKNSSAWRQKQPGCAMVRSPQTVRYSQGLLLPCLCAATMSCPSPTRGSMALSRTGRRLLHTKIFSLRLLSRRSGRSWASWP